jgi:hypothetical protein
MREKLIAFVQRHYPNALPTLRASVADHKRHTAVTN